MKYKYLDWSIESPVKGYELCNMWSKSPNRAFLDGDQESVVFTQLSNKLNIKGLAESRISNRYINPEFWKKWLGSKAILNHRPVAEQSDIFTLYKNSSFTNLADSNFKLRNERVQVKVLFLQKNLLSKLSLRIYKQ